jgi:two-component system invasion response regulator UvrY
MRILLADDDAMVRQNMRHILAEVLPNVMFGEAASGQQACDLVRTVRWELMIVDMALPVHGGLQTLHEIHAIAPKLPILIWTDPGDDMSAVAGLRAGAAGYLPKGSSPDEIIEAVQRILAGERYLSRNLAERLANRLATQPGVRRRDTLSPRELQLLRLRAAGKTPGEISSDLQISEGELGRLNLRATAALLRFALRTDITE